MNQRILMHKSIFALTFFLIFYGAEAQYYYIDVADLKASNNIYRNLIKNNIREITATSMESDNRPTEGFAFSKTIKNNGALVVTHTELETGGISNENDIYANDLLVKSLDSADNVLTTVDYSYDNNGNIILIKTKTDDTVMDVHSTELHQWFYSGNMPDSMIKVKNNTDSTTIHFKKDENNHIIEELWIKKGRTIEHYYYYYNAKAQLTDIVRFNAKAQQMLPDFLFEYNENGIISTLTQIPPGSSDYIIWQYVYDERGLKTKDVLFDKHRELLGTVTYSYK